MHVFTRSRHAKPTTISAKSQRHASPPHLHTKCYCLLDTIDRTTFLQNLISIQLAISKLHLKIEAELLAHRLAPSNSNALAKAPPDKRMESPAPPRRGVVSPSSFPSFSQLPPELQIRIYRLMASEPRTVHLTRKRYVVCHDPVPAVLQICHLSRKEAKKLYASFFPTMASGWNASSRSNVRFVWINFDVDTIQLPQDALFDIRPQDKERMQKVILEVKERWEELDDYRQSFAGMGKLRSLDFLSEAKLSEWGEFLEHVQKWFEEWYKSSEGWVLPEIRIIEQPTGAVMDYANLEEMLDVFHREKWEEEDARMSVASTTGEWTNSGGTVIPFRSWHRRPYRNRIRRGG